MSISLRWHYPVQVSGGRPGGPLSPKWSSRFPLQWILRVAAATAGSSHHNTVGLSTDRTFAGHSRPPWVPGGGGRELGNDHDHAPMAGGAGRGDHGLVAAAEGGDGSG